MAEQHPSRLFQVHAGEGTLHHRADLAATGHQRHQARGGQGGVNIDSALPTPRLMTLMPCGGKVGTVVEGTFTGVDLEEPGRVLFSHPNIKSEPIIPPPPPPPDPKKPPVPPPPKPPITKFKVTIAPDVPVGVHDVRLVNKWGVSNPRAFVVGDLTEVPEKEPNNDVDQAQRVELNT